MDDVIKTWKPTIWRKVKEREIK